MYEWYYAKENRRLGPVDERELRSLAVSGEILPSDLVWREGLRDWIEARKMEGLFPNSNQIMRVSVPPPLPDKRYRKAWLAYGGFLIACSFCAAGLSALFLGVELFDVLCGLLLFAGLGVVCYGLLDKHVINKGLPAEAHSRLTRLSWSIFGLSILFIMLPPLQVASWEARRAAEDAGQAAEVGYQEAINQVLQESLFAVGEAKTAAETAERLRRIGLSGCPADFAEAYVSYVHAWESMALVERQAAAYAAEGKSSEAMAEAFFRGLMGDPFGKAKEGLATEKQIKQDREAAHSRIKQSADRIEEAAVRHGVTFQ